MISLRYAGYRLAQRLSEALPSSTAFGLATRLADWQWRRSRPDRLAVQANLRTVLGRDVAEDAPAIREVFRNFGWYLVEFFSIHRVARPQLEVQGFEHLEQARRAGRGVIVLTAHFGNWEVGGVLIHRLGVPLHAVALPHDDPHTDRLFNAQRQRCGVRVVALTHDAARASLRCLRQGQALGILGDRDFSQNGLNVCVWGRGIRMPKGPAILSARSHAPVVPTFLVRNGPWAFRLCFEPPIWPPEAGADELALRALTQRYADVTARYVTQWPGQWLMFRPVV